jgi:hypothetical protein
VGKGKGRRAFSSSGRNPHWIRVVKKYGFTSHILMKFEKEACSFSLERALIKYYGRKNLCNFSDGGEGPSGMVHTQEWKDAISEKLSGRIVSDNTRMKIRNTS